MELFEHAAPPGPKFTRVLHGIAPILIILFFLSITVARADVATYCYQGNPLTNYTFDGEPIPEGLLLSVPEGITGCVSLSSPLPEGQSSYQNNELLGYDFGYDDNVFPITKPTPPPWCEGEGVPNWACDEWNSQANNDEFNFTTTNGQITAWTITLCSDYCNLGLQLDSSSGDWAQLAATSMLETATNNDPGVWVSNVPDSGSSLLLIVIASGSLIVGKRRLRHSTIRFLQEP